MESSIHSITFPLELTFFPTNIHPKAILLLPYHPSSWWHRDKSNPCHLSMHKDQDHECEPRAGTCAPTESCPHAHTHRRQQRKGEGGESESWEVQRRGNKSRRERMARTTWHFNRGFPLCTSSSLRSLCLQENYFT